MFRKIETEKRKRDNEETFEINTDFTRAWRILHEEVKLTNPEQINNIKIRLGITEASELEYCSREELGEFVECLRKIPKMVFQVAMKLEDKETILKKVNGLR